MRLMIGTHLRDNTDRNGKQSGEVDGCTAHEVIEVNAGHERVLCGLRRRRLIICGRSALALPSKQKPCSDHDGSSMVPWSQRLIM